MRDSFESLPEKLFIRQSQARISNIHVSLFDLVGRLKLENTLNVHRGCVNTLSWNKSGTLILSGSDDQHLIVTDPFSGKIVQSLRTGHRANIFSAKFLPMTNDNEVVSSSADGAIFYSQFDRSKCNRGFHCHSLPVYEVAVLPEENSVFLSCSEDGTLRKFDLRMKTECTCNGCENNIVLRQRQAITAMAVNENYPYQVAIGCVDSCVCLLDRRMMNGELCAKFQLPQSSSQHRVTSLSFDSSGKHLLASFCGEDIYLMDLTKSEDGEFILPEKKMDTKNKLATPRNIRLRGDWTDTGPRAMPRGREDPNRERTRSEVLLKRMTDMLTRWYSQRRGDESQASSNEPANSEASSSSSTSSSDSDHDPPQENVMFAGRGTAVRERSNGNNKANFNSVASSNTENSSEDRKLFRPKLLQVYKGHRNSRTMIKQSNFWGRHHIISGSDCGHIFFWRRGNGNLVMIIEADSRVVNCVQPHPFGPVLAASGIDYSIKIITPTAEKDEFDPSVAEELVNKNAILLEESRDTITLPALFMLRMLRHSLSSEDRDDRENENVE